MICPHCNNELRCHDFYGYYLGSDQWNKVGDIYKCTNDDCACYFHDHNDGELKEGYPC
jgi:hypothetical protein